MKAIDLISSVEQAIERGYLEYEPKFFHSQPTEQNGYRFVPNCNRWSVFKM